MVDHYNAFISYKHAKEDIAVAEAIQKGLEHFHVPGPIKRKTGMKKIERIFRDKDELPITSDLSDDISHALENADYLIVICSTRTKESVWVSREIDFFLKNHTRRQILTVLVDGEPQDVIPEILLKEDREITDENGNKQTIRVSLEPLSCDYRMGLKKAKREELPRLAAALLGCSYDELMNRHRQYKVQRLSLLFSGFMLLALIFGGYMYYSRNQIKKSYTESLKSQSRYLANESESLLAQERRLEALQLALAALPKNDERPVIPEAISALTSATLAYTTPQGLDIHAVCDYKMATTVDFFDVSKDGSYLAGVDHAKQIKIWNTDTHEEKKVPELTDRICTIRFTDEKTLLILTTKALYCYDVSKEEIVWTKEAKDSSFASGNDLKANEKGQMFLRTYNEEIYKTDEKSGKMQKIAQFDFDAEFMDTNIQIIDVSPDAKKIAASVYSFTNGYNIIIYDTETKTTIQTEPAEDRITDICWIDNDRLCVATFPNQKASVTTFTSTYLTESKTDIRCYNASDLSILWENQHLNSQVENQEDFLLLPKYNSILYYTGNTAEIYDVDTGLRLHRNNLNETIVDVSDNDGNGIPTYVTQNGGVATPFEDEETGISYVRYLSDELYYVLVKNGIYATQYNSCDIIFYNINVTDEEWTPFEEIKNSDSIDSGFYMDDRIFAAISSADNGEIYLNIFEPDSEKQTHRIKLDAKDRLSTTYKICGRFDNTLYLTIPGEQKLRLATVDIETGDYDESTELDVFYGNNSYCAYDHGKLCYYKRHEDYTYSLCIYDAITGDTQEIVLPYDNITPCPPYFFETQNKVYLIGEPDLIIDLDTEEITEVKRESWIAEEEEEQEDSATVSDTTSVTINPYNPTQFAISDDTNIYLIGKDGTVTNTISCEGQIALGMTYLPKDAHHDEEMLIIAYNNGALVRYRASDGMFLGKSEFSTYSSSTKLDGFEYDSESGLLYIQNYMLLNVIETDSFVRLFIVDNCFGHYIPSDRFITFAKHSENRIGYFRHYSVDDLINKANAILKGTEMSEELKSQYGLN